jgi:serine/threonine protein kinase
MIDSGTLLQGRFLIEEQIGMGGMGAVYRAVDQKFGSIVAIKETFYGDRELGEAFEREARLLNGLHHPILPHVSDYFTENGGHFLVMEFIEGEDLSEILKRGETFAVSTVMGWTMEILDGIDYLHSQDPPIIHRDIKPNNLKLTSRGRIVLLDFGMAKETSHNTLGARSVFGYSRRYSPLEQIEGTGTDPRSDIFSLGATVYHLLTGQPPVDVLARASAIVAGRPDPLLPVNAMNPDVPHSVAAILNSALALNADNRFETARAMSNALEYAIGTNPIARKPENENILAFRANQMDAQAEADAAHEAVGGTGVLETPDHPAFLSGENDPSYGESIKNLWRPDASEGGPVITDPMLGEDFSIPEHASASTSFRAEGSSDSAPYPIENVPARRSARPGYVLWVPALLICLALAMFATYRAVKTNDTAPNVSSEPKSDTTSEPVTNEAAESVAGGVDKGQAENSSAEFAESQSGEAIDLENDDVATPVDNPIELRKGPINTRRESSTRVAAATKRATKAVASEVATKKPVVSRNIGRQVSTESRRVVRPAFQQPHVSSIEAIFTGVPYEGRRRRWESDRDLSYEEEMRRRQIRRIMRENRRRQLPF